MIEIVKNKSNISEEEINNIITRVKALIITSDNKILLGHSFCEYQFPGGHVENNEALLPALKRVPSVVIGSIASIELTYLTTISSILMITSLARLLPK